MCPAVRPDQDFDMVNGKPVTIQEDQEYVDAINRKTGPTAPPAPPPPTPEVPVDFVDQVVREQNKNRPTRPQELAPQAPLDREVGYTQPEPVISRFSKDSDRFTPYVAPRSGPDYSTRPVVSLEPQGTPGGSNVNLGEETGPLDFTQRGTDTRDPDSIFQDVAKGAEGEYSRLWTQAEEAKASGDVGKGVFSYIGALGVKAGWGAFEGATFVARPWLWAGAVQGAGDLIMDKKFYDSEGKETGSARGTVISQFMADPVGGLAFGLGNMAGGMAVSEGAGKLTDRMWGAKGRATTLTDVTGAVDEAGDVSLAGKSSTRNLPRGEWEELGGKPNRLMITAEAEDVATSTKVRTGAWGDVAMEVSDQRTPLGVKRGMVLEMGEGEIKDLTMKGQTQVKGLKATFMDTPTDMIKGSDFMEGLTDFKETQLGTEARAGARNYSRAGQAGMGMDDSWLTWTKGGENPGKLSPWEVNKPGMTLEGTDFMDFKGKVRGGARVIEDVAKVEPDTPFMRPEPGPRTPLSKLSNPEGWPSKLAQTGAVDEVQRLIKTGAKDTSLGSDIGAGGSGASGLKMSTGVKSVTVPTGDVTFFTPVASQWAPAGAVGSGLNLLGRARSKLDQRPGLEDYEDSSQRVKAGPVVSFDNYTDRKARTLPDTLIDNKTGDDTIQDPLTDHWTDPYEDNKPKPDPQDTLQDHWVDQIHDPRPPPPPDPLPDPGGDGGGGGLLAGAFGPGGGLWGGPRRGVGSRSKKKTYQVADPMKLIGGSSTIKGQKVKKDSFKKMARRMVG